MINNIQNVISHDKLNLKSNKTLIYLEGNSHVKYKYV